MRALLSIVGLLAACGGRGSDPPGAPSAGSTLDVRDLSASAALVQLGQAVREAVSVDADVGALATCAHVTLVSPTPRPARELVTMLDEALRPAGLHLEHRAGTIRMRRTLGVPPPPECAPPRPPTFPRTPEGMFPPTPPDPAAPDPRTGAIVAGIHDDARGHYRLSAEAARQLGASQDLLMRSVRIIPYERDGLSSGLRLYGIRRGSVVSALGLENGDVVTAVAGHPVGSPDDALAAYSLLRGRSDTTLAIERRGQPLTLSYHVDDAQ